MFRLLMRGRPQWVYLDDEIGTPPPPGTPEEDLPPPVLNRWVVFNPNSGAIDDEILAIAPPATIQLDEDGVYYLNKTLW